MAFENIQGKKFDPVGKCIYCGSDGGEDGLRTEHIVPFSLGGNAELPEASCTKCEGVTSYLDGYLAKHVFYHFRVHADTQTRNPKERPTKLPAAIIIDGAEDEYEFAIPDHPHFTVLPALGEPGILAGKKPESGFVWKIHSYYHIPEDLHERLNVRADATVEVRSSGKLNLPTFCRAIAKIAYCNWIAIRGLNSIRPLVITDLICGKYPYPSYFVGCEVGDPPPPDPESFHTIQFATETYGRLKLLVASVRLFASSGTDEQGFPVYLVVLGVPKSF